MTVREALTRVKAELAGAGVESPALDARLLLAEVLGVDRSSPVVAAGGSADPIGPGRLAEFFALARRRAAGECVAYLLGRKEFYGLEFAVNQSVLVPRPETETLVEAALERLSAGDGRPPRALDLCVGSGAVAVAVKRLAPEVEVWAADVCPRALETAKANAARLLPPGAIRFFLGDLFEALSGEGPATFDLIASNPPYVPSGEIPGLSPEVRGEPALALDGGPDGLSPIREIVARAPGFLRPGGTLALEADPRQMREIAALMEAAGFAGARTRRDLSGAERVIEGRAPSTPRAV